MSDSAYIKSQKSFSKIWLIPLLTLLLGAWMVYDYLQSRGQLIYISMPNAKGIVVGQTEIKTRSVPIGTVSNIRLSEDTSTVIVSARINTDYVDLLTDDAQIWSVEPRIDESGISGLNTLFSGIYLEFQPGTSEVTTDVFTLLPEPPLLSRDVKGKRYQLHSKDAEVMEVGAPVYFQNYRVGQVETAEFNIETEAMHYQVFIEAPYDALVVDNSLFWVDSGINLDISAAGVSMNTATLTKILRGGIAFAVPPGETRGKSAPPMQVFTLSPNYKQSLDDRYTEVAYYIVKTDESIRGLFTGAPVELRGVRIGTVVQAPATLPDQQQDSDFLAPFISNQASDDGIAILIKIEFRRIHQDVELAQTIWNENISDWIERGLGASLEIGNLLTGALYISLDFHKNKRFAVGETLAGYPVLPSVSGGIKQFSSQLTGLMDKLNQLNIENTLDNVDEALVSIRDLSKQIEQLVANDSMRNLPASLEQSMSQLNQTLKDYGKTAPLYKDLQSTLSALQSLSQDLQPFAKTINENPNSLLFDNKAEADILPRKEK